jgi:hypothetical protein
MICPNPKNVLHFKPIFNTATPGVKKEWIRNFIHRIEGDPKNREIKVYFNKFPTQALSVFETNGAGGGTWRRSAPTAPQVGHSLELLPIRRSS